MSARPIPNAEEPKRGRGIQCSDCRTVMLTYYYALDERPLCARCQQPYAARIERGEGGGVMGRTLVYGVGAALAGAVLTALSLQIFGLLRMACSIGVGYLVGTAIKKANGGWPGRQFQLLAVVCTYLALGLGSVAPTVMSLGQARRELRQAAADSAAAARARAAADTLDDDEDPPAASPVADVANLADSLEAARSRPRPHRTPELENATKIAAVGVFGMLVRLMVLMITLPLLGLLQYGIYPAGVGVLAFMFGMKKAWDLTEGGVALTLSGPHRVGEGPIAPMF